MGVLWTWLGRGVVVGRAPRHHALVVDTELLGRVVVHGRALSLDAHDHERGTPTPLVCIYI